MAPGVVDDAPMDDQPKLLWSPSEEAISKTMMNQFRLLVNSRHSLSLEDYEGLWKWSIEHVELFWPLVWEFCVIKSSAGWTEVLPEGAQVDQVPAWFVGARLNYAENLLENGRTGDEDLALMFANEEEVCGKKYTFGELKSLVARCASALKESNVTVGSVVGLYAPNLPESTAFTLAAASLGAVVTAVSPDFGAEAVLDRFGQTQPVLMLVANAVLYNGKVHRQAEKVQAVLEGCPSIKQVVWVNYRTEAEGLPLYPSVKVEEWTSFLKPASVRHIEYAQLPFNHPLFILYSSGTTGKPKCLVHSAGGTLLQHMKEHMLHADLGPGDRLLQYTTVGWMMWQWQMSALGTGCALVLYDGSPFRPNDSHLLRVLEACEVSAFGTSAKYLQRLEEAKASPPKLDKLKVIFSTGSPLPASTFEWITDAFGPLMIASITGGTDIISLFAGGNPTLPVYSGLIQCRCLGMAVYAYDSQGKPVYDTPGDLVCTRPFPAQPVFFWNDTPYRSAYNKAYFSSTWPHVWHHGDFIQICSRTGGVLMLGRSDGTLNPAGVRFGSADLYAITGSAEFRDEIQDALAVGVRRDGDPDERVVLFLQLHNAGQTLPEGLEAKLRLAIRTRLSPRHVPALILPCPAIPYTLNGKKVEVAVKRILCGIPDAASNAGSLINPESLEYFRSINIP